MAQPATGTTSDPTLVVEVDVAPVSINRQVSEHYRSRARRRRQERVLVAHALSGTRPPPGPWIVTFTRLGSRALDSDNLAYSFKTVRDQVAEYLGVDDSDASVEWHYTQEVRREPAKWIRIPGKMYVVKPKTKLRVWCRVEIRTRAAE